MTTLSNTTVTEMAIEMTILDAIEKGHTSANEIFEYIKSDVFERAVANYKRIIENEF